MDTEIRVNIVLPKEELNFMNKLLTLTGEEIYKKYGLKRDETITNTAKFPNGIEADIKLVICDGDNKPYTEGVLFHDGSEVSCTECEEFYEGEWCFKYNDIEYVVCVMEEI